MPNPQNSDKEFADFAIYLTPAGQGGWTVQLTDCPVKKLRGPKGAVSPAVTREQLVRLRSRHGWPNEGELKAIGTAVWQSVMTPRLEAAFFTCLETSPKLRLVVSTWVEGDQPAQLATPAILPVQPPSHLRLQELPIEALYNDEIGFLAANPDTPISRSLNSEPDRAPARISGPLRVLAVAAAPTDKPGKADIQAEKQVLDQALGSLAGVVVEWCDPPTRTELEARLQQGFHILHFIGHGGFDSVGQDPTSRPYLCLEDSAHHTAPVDAGTLQALLQSSSVRLIVMTACSSAAPTPDEEPYHAHAFDGVAQSLLRKSSAVSAVVAMQFDMEASAAVLFSQTFYTNLLASDPAGQPSGIGLDQVVARCRKALIAKMDLGHRAWVTPVLYSRCQDGRVFDWGQAPPQPPEDTKITGPSPGQDRPQPVVSSSAAGSGAILIVTVTKTEAKAVLDTFSQAAGQKWTRQAIGNKTYYSLGAHGGAPVFMVQSEMGTATPAGALLTVHQAIEALRPQAVIMCGIAFGLRPDKQQLGDIMVAKQLLYYEPQKIDLQRGEMPRGDRTTSSERLLDRFRSADLEWAGAPTRFGLVLSGEKLVNDPAFRDWLLKVEPEALGGEMEGAGLYAAARDAKVDWILVKAICDWADGAKNDDAQPLAARNAAEFVLYVLQLGGWAVDAPTATVTPARPSSPVAGPVTPAPAQIFPLTHIDPDNPPFAIIRSLLQAAFLADPEGLRRFCEERPTFRPVLPQLGPGMGLDDMIDKVIGLCFTYLLWDELLTEIANFNPAQYARFEPRLRG